MRDKQTSGVARLSGREKQVALLAADGNTDEQIAHELGLSVATINSYWTRIRGKIGASSRTHAVAMLLRGGALDSDEYAVVSMVAEADDLDFESLVESMPTSVVILDADLRVVYANIAAGLITGSEPDILVVRTMADLGYEGDRLAMIGEAVRTVLLTGATRHVQYQCLAGARHPMVEAQVVAVGRQTPARHVALYLSELQD